MDCLTKARKGQTQSMNAFVCPKCLVICINNGVELILPKMQEFIVKKYFPKEFKSQF